MTDKETAKKLCRQHRLPFLHALYHKDGTYYHHLIRFPGALLDKDGFIAFSTKEEYGSCRYLSFGEEVNVRSKKGIKSIPGYNYYSDIQISSTKPQYVETKKSIGSTIGEPQGEYNEGGTQEIALEIQRRNPQLRRNAIKHYGTICQVCGFDFGKTYGAIGEGFIELHHLKPLSLTKISTLTTFEDVAVVCSNCHRMLHRNGIRPLSIEELTKLLKTKRAP